MNFAGKFLLFALTIFAIGCGGRAPENKVTKTHIPKQDGKYFGGIAGDGAWEGKDANAPEEIPPPRDEAMPGEGLSDNLE